MKPLRLAFALTLFTAIMAHGEEDRYDVLGKVLTPFFTLLAPEGGNHALALAVRIEQMTDLPPELAGAHADIAIEAPNKLRLHGPVLGENLTIVRNGQKIWVYPGSVAKALIASKDDQKQLPPTDKKYQLGDFSLPIPIKELNLLPILFVVKDLGHESLDGQDCRVLDLSFMAEIAKSADFAGWVGRVWVRPDYTPARFTIARPGWNIVLRFDRVAFSEKLPAATWEPTSEEASDVLELEPKDYSRFLRAITGYKKKAKKE
jgi:hypothetical protein